MKLAKELTAWSPIHYNEGEGADFKRKVIKPGDKVTAEKINVDEDGWKELVESGAVRDQEWPEGLNPDNPNGLSPNAHRMERLRQERANLEEEMNNVTGASSGSGASDEATEEKPENSLFGNRQ